MKQYLSSDYRNYIYEGESSNMAIVVDGIIGAGKSTLAGFISDYLELPLYEELKDESSDSLAQRMLDKFYENQERWSAIIQVMFLNDRFRDIKAIEANGNEAILDRSIYGDEIFAKTIHDRGQMTADEFTIYRDLLYNMLQHIKPPELLIYVDVSIDTAMDRINQRSRSTEADLIPRDYMEDLRGNYESWYESFNICPKVRLDFNECCLDENGNLKEDMQEKIIKVLNEHLILK